MRPFLVVGLLLLAPCSRASDTQDPSRQLQNLVYYPHARQFVLTSQFTVSAQDSGQTQDNFGAQTAVFDTTAEYLSLGLSYGVIDGLRLGVSETELFDLHTELRQQGIIGAAEYHSSGPSDPTLTAAGRYLESGRFSADAVLVVTPGIGHALIATPSREGNNLTGAWIATLEAPFYVTLGRTELEVAGRVTHGFRGTASTGAPDSTREYASYWNGSILLQGRVHFGENWFLQPGVNVAPPYSYAAGPSGNPNQYTVSWEADPALTAGYLAARWCLLTAGVVYAHSEVRSPSAGLSAIVLRNQTYAHLRAAFTF